jgi:hypothetical protein
MKFWWDVAWIVVIGNLAFWWGHYEGARKSRCLKCTYTGRHRYFVAPVSGGSAAKRD